MLIRFLLSLFITVPVASTCGQQRNVFECDSPFKILQSRLLDITSKVQIAPLTQKLLIASFKEQDCAIQAEIDRGQFYKGPTEFTLTQKELKLIANEFGAKEYEKISIPISNINYALLFRKALLLKKRQINQLILASKKISTFKSNIKTDFNLLQKILTESQYRKYFQIFSSSNALKWTYIEWSSLKKSFDRNELDSLNINKIIFDHQLEKLSKINYFTSLGLRDSARTISANKSFKVKMLREALGPEKYRRYFELQNEKVIQSAIEGNWKALRGNNLILNSDSIGFFKENRRYEVNLRLAKEDYYLNNSLQGKHLIQYWLENKPEMLKRLDSVLLKSSINRIEKF